MNVSLTPTLERLIQKKVKAGQYHSASEVVREALRLLQERDRLRELRRAELKKEIQIGLDELDRGEGITLNEELIPDFFESIKRRGRERLKARRNRQ